MVSTGLIPYGHKSVFARTGNLFLIVALLVLTGGQWAALQSVAWIGMVASYSEHAPLAEALSKTFDGKHPCCLCKAIDAAKKSEKKSEIAPPSQKVEFPPLRAGFVLIAPPPFEFLSGADAFAQSFPQEPPTPPPRGIFV